MRREPAEYQGRLGSEDQVRTISELRAVDRADRRSREVAHLRLIANLQPEILGYLDGPGNCFSFSRST